MLADVYGVCVGSGYIFYGVAVCMLEEWEETFRCIASVDEAGVESLCLLVGVRWVSAEAVISENASGDKATEYAFRVCRGRRDVEVEILRFFVYCRGESIALNGDC